MHKLLVLATKQTGNKSKEMPNKFKVTLYQDVFTTRGGNYQDDNAEFPKSHSIDTPKRGFSFF